MGAQAPSCAAMRIRFVKCLAPSGFFTVAYRQWAGPPGAPTLVCVHGLTRNSRDFEPFAEVMRAHCRVVAPDMPGRGLSDRLPNAADYNFQLYLAVVATLLARLDVDEVDWVGTSMGALIGMMLAATPGNPIRRLVLNDAGTVTPKAFLARLGAYVGVAMTAADLRALEAGARLGYGPQADLSDAQWRLVAASGARAEADGSYTLDYDPRIGDVYRAGELNDVVLWPLYDRVACPTLLLRGGKSDVLSREVAEEMTQRGPKAQLVEFAGVAHPPWLMNEGQIGAVREFLLR